MKKRDFLKTGLVLAAGSITPISKANIASRSKSGIKGLRKTMPNYHTCNVANLFSQKAFNDHVKTHQLNLQQLENNLNGLIFKPDSIKSVLVNNSSYSSILVENTSNYYNHKLFFKQFENHQLSYHTHTIVNDIELHFGSINALKKDFNKTASILKNEGWAWLVYNNNSLKVEVTNYNYTPISDINNYSFPLIAIDLHKDSYAIDYGKDTNSYISNLVDSLNWDYIETRYRRAPEFRL